MLSQRKRNHSYLMSYGVDIGFILKLTVGKLLTINRDLIYSCKGVMHNSYIRRVIWKEVRFDTSTESELIYTSIFLVPFRMRTSKVGWLTHGACANVHACAALDVVHYFQVIFAKQPITDIPMLRNSFISIVLFHF